MEEIHLLPRFTAPIHRPDSPPTQNTHRVYPMEEINLFEHCELRQIVFKKVKGEDGSLWEKRERDHTRDIDRWGQV